MAAASDSHACPTLGNKDARESWCDSPRAILVQLGQEDSLPQSRRTEPRLFTGPANPRATPNKHQACLPPNATLFNPCQPYGNQQGSLHGRALARPVMDRGRDMFGPQPLGLFQAQRIFSRP